MIAGMLLAVIFGTLGLLHLYWAAGGRWASAVTVPEVNGRRAFNPSRGGTVVVALGLFFACAIVFGQLGWWGALLPRWFFRTVLLGLAVMFLLRAIGNLNTFGFTKRVRDTAFAWWDTRVYSPLCVLIAVCALLIIW